ncbi:MAG: ABC transporter ATP-binding protein [Chitinophagales bacterium]
MKNLKILYKLLIQWKWKFLISSMLLVCGMFFRTLEPLIIQVLVDNLLPMLNGTYEASSAKVGFFTKTILSILPAVSKEYPLYVYFLALGAIYFAISFTKGTIMFIAKAINASATESAINSLRNNIFSHIQKLPMQYFSDAKTGELTQRATGDIDTVRNFISNQTVEIIRLSAVFLFSFFMIYAENKTFAMISICLVPITAIAAFYFFKKEKKIWQLHEDESDKLNNLTQESLGGIRVIKAFANEEVEIEKFEKQNKAKLDIALIHARLHTVYWPLSDMIVNAQVFLSVLFGAWFALNGEISIGQLMAFYTYVAMVAFPLRQVSRLLSQMGMALVAVGRIQEVLDAEEEDLSGKNFNGKLKGKIEFRNVSYQYKGAKEFALKNVSFTIQAGENVALIGPLGSGKSTLMKLLLRFYEPTQGEIFIDDEPIKIMSKKDLRSKIGVVLQKAFLFSDTIGNNISYINSEKINILETATMAGLTDVDGTFVKGFDTVVGEKGVSLSGGQKQRIALARTLLSDPEVLVLDDVTSAVDTITEKEILNNLKKVASTRTTINITHRMSSLIFAHKVMIIEEGKLTGFGTEKDLEKTNAFFKQVLAIQKNASLN